jgi:hypothetical protein
VFDTGQGRKTDATDAHAIVMVALRDKGLREVSTDPELMVLRIRRCPCSMSRPARGMMATGARQRKHALRRGAH